MYKFNIFTDNLDLTLSDAEVISIVGGNYLKIDQTTPQTVINGMPRFDGGISTAFGSLITDGTTNLTFNKYTLTNTVLSGSTLSMLDTDINVVGMQSLALYSETTGNTPVFVMGSVDNGNLSYQSYDPISNNYSSAVIDATGNPVSFSAYTIVTDYLNIIGSILAQDKIRGGSFIGEINNLAPTIAFTGTGLNDATIAGAYSGSDTIGVTYTIEIVDGTSSPNTIRFKKNSGAWDTIRNIASPTANDIYDGIQIQFASPTGHTTGDQWTITVPFTTGTGTFYFGSKITDGTNSLLFDKYTLTNTALTGVNFPSIENPSASFNVPIIKHGLWVYENTPSNDSVFVMGDIGADNLYLQTFNATNNHLYIRGVDNVFANQPLSTYEIDSTILKLSAYSTNGFVKFINSNGTLGVDTNTYLTADPYWTRTGTTITPLVSGDTLSLTGDLQQTYVAGSSSAINKAYVLDSQFPINVDSGTLNAGIYLTARRNGTESNYTSAFSDNTQGLFFWLTNSATYSGSANLTVYNEGLEGLVTSIMTYDSSGNTASVYNYGIKGQIVGNEVLTAGTLNVTNYGIYSVVGNNSTPSSVTNYGLYIDLTGAHGTNYGIYDASTAPWVMAADNKKLTFGTSSDASIYYDATNFVLNPKEVGTGYVDIKGGLNLANGYPLMYNGYPVLIADTTKNNMFVGIYAGNLTLTGDYNTCVGTNAGTALTTGEWNFLIGSNCGSNLTSGSWNFFAGKQAGQSAISASGNVALGDSCLYHLDSGFGNVAVGNYALFNNLTAGDQIGIGERAGYYALGGYGIYIGSYSDQVSPYTFYNASAIGNYAQVGANNTLSIGAPNGDDYAVNTIFGGTTTSEKLEVVGSIKSTNANSWARIGEATYAVTGLGNLYLSQLTVNTDPSLGLPLFTFPGKFAIENDDLGDGDFGSNTLAFIDYNSTAGTIAGFNMGLAKDSSGGYFVNLECDFKLLDSSNNYYDLTAGSIYATGDGTIWSDGTTGTTPTSGAGTRFMWIPAKKALRAGAVGITHSTNWDDANIGDSSIVLGNGKASGISSILIGGEDSSEVTGLQSRLIGTGSLIREGDTGVGRNLITLSSGMDDVLVGWTLTGYGTDNIIVGGDIVVQGSDNAVLGRNFSWTEGDNSLVLGSGRIGLIIPSTGTSYMRTDLTLEDTTSSTYYNFTAKDITAYGTAYIGSASSYWTFGSASYTFGTSSITLGTLTLPYSVDFSSPVGIIRGRLVSLSEDSEYYGLSLAHLDTSTHALTSADFTLSPGSPVYLQLNQNFSLTDGSSWYDFSAGKFTIYTDTNTSISTEHLDIDLSSIYSGLNITIPILNDTAYSSISGSFALPYALGIYDNLYIFDKSGNKTPQLTFSTLDLLTNSGSIGANLTSGYLWANWDINPDSDNSYNLGNASLGLRWKDAHFSGTGNFGEVAVGNNVILDGSNSLYFAMPDLPTTLWLGKFSATTTASHSGALQGGIGIEYIAYGGGTPTMTSGDTAFIVDTQKANYLTTTQDGDVNGIYSILRLGGTASFGCAYLADVVVVPGTTNWASQWEGVTRDSSNTHSMDIQFGVMGPNWPTYQGYYAQATAGVLDSAFSANSASSSAYWSTAFSISGKFSHGIDLSLATGMDFALNLPNNVPITAVHSGSNIDILHLDSSNNLVLGAGAADTAIGSVTPYTRLFVSGTGSSGILGLVTSDFSIGSTGSGLLINTGATSGNTYTSISALKGGWGAWSDLILQYGGGSVGIGTGTSAPLGVLEVKSTTSAFLPPRMTTTQKNAISSPSAGMIVYDTTLNKLCVYTTTWETVTSV